MEHSESILKNFFVLLFFSWPKLPLIIRHMWDSFVLFQRIAFSKLFSFKKNISVIKVGSSSQPPECALLLFLKIGEKLIPSYR